MRSLFFVSMPKSRKGRRTVPLGIVVQSLNCVWLFVTLWTAAGQDSLSFTISQSLLRFIPIESVMSSNHLILCLPLLLCPQSFPALRCFPMSQPFVSGGQSTGASASALVLPMNISWLFSFRTGLISLLSKGLWRVFSSTTNWKHQFFSAQLYSSSQVFFFALTLWMIF